MDGFGGYMLRGNPPSKWKEYIKFNQGKSINETLIDLWRQGVNPDVTSLSIRVDSRKYSVSWTAVIDASEDDKAFVGMSTVGSAGNNADSRALGQVANLKQRVSGAKDYTLVLDFRNPSGIYIRQYFYKFTIPSKYPPHKNSVKRVKQYLPTVDDKNIDINKDDNNKEEKPVSDINNLISTLNTKNRHQDIDPTDYISISDNFSLLNKILNLNKS